MEMDPPKNILPVFALDSTTDWDGLHNAVLGFLRHHESRGKKFGPIMAFAPMTEPENPDTWEPMKAFPQNLLLFSLARHADAVILTALEQARDVLGEVRHASAFLLVRVNEHRPLADVYAQMERAGILSFAWTNPGPDDPSFFFLRGAAAVKAFDRGLRIATR